MQNAHNNSKQGSVNHEQMALPKNRIEAVIRRSGMSTNAFARHIGLPRGENLYQIKKGNNGVSLGLADRIVAKFPEVSKLWLLTGDGPMLNEKTEAAGLTPWVYFAGAALHALIAKDVDYPESSAAHYADRMVELYARKGGEQ